MCTSACMHMRTIVLVHVAGAGAGMHKCISGVLHMEPEMGSQVCKSTHRYPGTRIQVYPKYKSSLPGTNKYYYEIYEQ